MKNIKVSEFLKNNKYLKAVNEVDKDIIIKSTEIARLGLAIYSNFKYFSPGRIQLVGEQEYKLFQNLDFSKLEQFFQEDIPVIIFSRNNVPSKEFLNIATKYNILVCKSVLQTANVFSKVYTFLERFLAEQTQVHGVMLSIYGKGVLLKGPSGIGKSEVALELIKRGHILISDDIVIFKRLDENTLSGSSPELLQNKMEIRGIGIVDIQKLFGVTFVLLHEELDLIINLVDSNQVVDRIGNDYLYEEILEVKKKKINIPILSGKNIANLIEVAVANFQLVEDYNYNASEEFVKNLQKTLEEKKIKKEGNENNKTI